MATQTKRTLAAVAAAGAVALLLGGAILYPQVTQAQDATATPAATEESTPGTQGDATAPARPGRWGEWGGDQGAALADALGITADELQAAYEQAAQAALDQAVADGLITQEQADALAARGLNRGFHFGGRGMGDVDAQALLADALGITADELQAAQNEAEEAQLDAAVEAGNLTQEQADALKAQRDLRQYVAPRVQQALEDAVAAAVDEGVVTQEQADAFLQRGQGFGPGALFGRFGDEFGGMFGGRFGHEFDDDLFEDGMFGGRGFHEHGMQGGRGGRGPGGMMPGATPETTPETTPQGQGG